MKHLLLSACVLATALLEAMPAQAGSSTTAVTPHIDTTNDTGAQPGRPSTTAVTPRAQLLKRLQKLQNTGIMTGHQDDPVYGHSWKWDENRSDVREVCGDYPAVMGFDLGKIEHAAGKNLDGVPFDRMRREIVAQHERGGIVTLSWHADNPVTGKNAWDATNGAVTAVLAEGAMQDTLKLWLKRVGMFIRSLKTTDGTTIPVIFRPWHEMNGSWFWWGSSSCTPHELEALYRFTHHELTDVHGCDNIVWAYSPNYQQDDDEERFLKYYPGDAFVDLVGIDIYDFDHDNAQYQQRLKQELDVVTRVGDRHHKLAAITETGARLLPDSLWFTQVFWPVAEAYRLSYALFWRNAWDNVQETYMASPGQAAAADFRAFYRLERTLFVKDIKRKK